MTYAGAMARIGQTGPCAHPVSRNTMPPAATAPASQKRRVDCHTTISALLKTPARSA